MLGSGFLPSLISISMRRNVSTSWRPFWTLIGAHGITGSNVSVPYTKIQDWPFILNRALFLELEKNKHKWWKLARYDSSEALQSGNSESTM